MANEKHENAERIQTSLLNAAEKKALVWLAERQPRWVTSDFLTYLGVAAAVLYAASCWLSTACNINFLWLASFFLVMNWYGDSLDGTIARVRQTQRPKYGFFIDHSLDALTTCLFCIGMGLSPLMQLSISLFIMGGYLCMSIYTYLSTIVMDKFRLTYGKLGPTEMRLIIITVFILRMYLPLEGVGFRIGATWWTVYDCIGAAVAAGLFLTYIGSLVKDLRYLAKIDPLKPFQPKDK
ncbi:MAG: CDP-alcohol phosphatidyltransferase family protein [Muribaculaceae bacterium]|nr:CDP-alcohol phosphatidyltransferase family protein [Muribaculaceae bacterium]MDE5968296.1 CDP-alcohol phosphatidyltransferase family protein [Muribaculaceae bacterium]